MNKPFCDICGQPALEEMSPFAFCAKMPAGDPRRGFEIDRDGSGHDGVRQCLAVAHVSFTFEQHARGFGGPPDLCAKHARELVQAVLDKIPTPDRIIVAVTKEL